MSKYVGKIIHDIDLIDDCLSIKFEDGSQLKVYDDGQSCCEHRYMHTDDDLKQLIGDTLIDILIKDATHAGDEDDYHEIQFLEIKTNTNFCTVCSHNEHNGWYGGFSITLDYAGAEDEI